ncbi:hypothetical protein BHU72_04225 [Desulfuribacillus stibiiarsenatis]|uniref:Major facilitator superfamily (MFS) profile domain-containing protein n=1 Tax=Desulfuribacillus stibiiarsenatis TaxID=1390249 RepID=A0A1E5L5H0_9FIRM|nr:MFS transporter [Desulfuribacillus stibiiarsenatis]OEH85308.1 hypothetical protein BHU72_04225 [Desulfuribacillus stibiiarsenatis]
MSADNTQKLVPLLSFTIFFSVINGTMFNVAIPNISTQFSILPSQVSWVVTGYTVIFALSAAIFGKLADMYPVKNLISTGLVLFNIGSLLGFLAEWYPMLLTARYIQACGAGSIPALAMLVATRYAPPEKRGKVLGFIASTVAFGSGIGPVLGGFITNTWEWNYLFLISLFSLLAIYFYHKWLPKEEVTGGALDIKGALLLAFTIAIFLVAVNQLIFWLLPVGLLMTFLVRHHMISTENPFIQPSLIQNRLFRNGLIAAFVTVGTVFATLFMIPIMLRDMNHLSSGEIGLVLFPGAMSASVMGAISGRIADRVGSIPVVYAGMSLLFISLLLLSFFAGSLPIVITSILLILYIGFSFIQSSLSNTVSRVLPPQQTGIGMGLYNLTFFISGAFISAISGKLLDFNNPSFQLNPLHFVDSATIYSNISFSFMISVMLGLLIFHRAYYKIHLQRKATN